MDIKDCTLYYLLYNMKLFMSKHVPYIIEKVMIMMILPSPVITVNKYVPNLAKWNYVPI